MTLTFEGLLLFVLFVLPGVVARSEAERVSPIPPDKVARSVIRELADALSYSFALSPLAAIVAGLGLWISSAFTIGLDRVVTLGLGGLFQFAPIHTAIALLIYVGASLLIAEVAGATRVFAIMRARLLDLLPSGLGITDDPIWYTVLDDRLAKSGHTEAFLNVYLDDGTRYTGVKLLAPIVADDVPDRDFAIWKARHYSADGKVIELDPDEIVLLNTRRCRAVEVKYVTPRALDRTTVTVQSSGESASEAPPGGARIRASREDSSS